ncbi:MAG: phospho-N-acetylmuramoyl-pentapeptide-transferase, partial [Myxococcales bacterium]
MLYHLLYPLAGQFAIFNVFRYPSFRIVAAFIFSLLLGMIIGPSVIERLRRRQHGQSNVREDTPETHQKKAGTPTMGGGLILLCTLLGTLLLADLANRYVWTVVLVFAGYGGIGFLDDYLKLSKRNSKGLPGRLKLLFQTLVLLGAFAVNLDLSKGWSWPFAIDPHLTLPFVATNAFNLELGWLYLPFAWIVI